MSDKSIEQIILDCRQGKKRGYKPLYQHYYGYVSAIAIRYGSSFEEAQEVINDVFLKVFEKMPNYYDPTFPFKPWLRRVAIHCAIDYLRKYKQDEQMLDMFDVDQPIQDSVFDELNANDILQLVQQMPQGYRVVFNLHAVEGYKHVEIAELLGINEGTSKSNLHKARIWLQKEMIKRKFESKESGYGS